MAIAAIGVILAVAAMSIFAWRKRPNVLGDFGALWQSGPWAKQLVVDFYGLEIVLVLWMATHAYEAGSWVVFGLCVAAMPFLGSMAAAAYWLLAVA